MFGTLIADLQRKSPLTFVENPDTASALSRNRREKRHTSCEECRARKTRCSGQLSGCDRCAAYQIECCYPERGPRRKRRSSSRQAPSKPSVASVENGPSYHGHEKIHKGDQHLAGDHSTGERQSVAGSQPVYPASETSSNEIQRTHPGRPCDPMDTTGMIDPTVDNVQANADLGVMAPMSGQQWNPMAYNTNILFGSTDMDPMTTSTFDLANAEYGEPSWIDSPFALLSPKDGSTQSLIAGTPQRDGPVHPETDTAPSSWAQSRPSKPPSRKRTASPTTMDTRMPTKTTKTSTSPASPIPLKSKNHRLDDRRRSRSSLHNHRVSKCDCPRLTAALFESLCVSSAVGDNATIDTLLRHFRLALAHCSTTLDCLECAHLPENSMLLAMAGQYMSTICERLVKCLVEMINRERDADGFINPSAETWMEDDSDGRAVEMQAGGEEEDDGTDSESEEGEMWVSTYKIESATERIQVLACLVTVQLTEFTELLEKLKAKTSSKSGHAVLLGDAEERIKASWRLLKSHLNNGNKGKRF